MSVRNSVGLAFVMVAFFVASNLVDAAAKETGSPSPLFIVEFTTGPAWLSDKPFNDQPHAADHSANLRRLRDNQMLVLGARHGAKGMLVLRAASEGAARSEIERDPAVLTGVFDYSIEELRVFYGGCIELPAPPPEG